MNKPIPQKSVQLVDVESRHEQHPETFLIPCRRCRENIRQDGCVKLIFEFADDEGSHSVSGERMWAKVLESADGKAYVGALDNVPTVVPLKYGMFIRFGPEHICDIYPDE